MRLITALNPYNGIRMNNLDLTGPGSILPPEAHFAYLNALMPTDRIDLISARRELDKHLKDSKPKKSAPLLLLLYLLLLAVPIAVMWLQVDGLDRDIRDIEAFLNDPVIEERQAALERRETDTIRFRTIEAQYNELIEWEESLNRVSSRMLDLFIVQFRGMATVTHFYYDERSNIVRIDAVSDDPDSATRYVDALKFSDMVSEVNYTGYTVSPEGETSFSIDVTLAEKERKEAE
jgi:hypothetical protein